MLPNDSTLVQEGDLVHVTMLWEDRERVETAFAAGPVEEGEH